MIPRLNVMGACKMLSKLALTGANMALHRITRHGTQKEAAGTDGQTLEQTKLSQVAHKAIKAIRKYHRAINESRAQKRK
ncbi:hypothetical protein Tco_1012145, partial [Tanacetum coccineum]